MATRVGRGKIQLAACDGPFPKTPQQMQKSRRYLLHKPSYSQLWPKFCWYGNGGWSGESAIGGIRWPISPLGWFASWLVRPVSDSPTHLRRFTLIK